MQAFKHKHILLAVCGGIAAYKCVELVRRLTESGADVRVIMSEGAQEFVTPLTFQAVSGHAVHTELFDDAAESGMGHIELARWADAVLLAPASANRIAALAQGMADDLITTVCLACRAPLFVAPAMNKLMWAHQAVQHNVQTLSSYGAIILHPDSGEQACGDTGVGRMQEPLDLCQALTIHFAKPLVLAGLRVVITAGPTQEPLDPVRYISNHSSGKMGFAVAAAAQAAGAVVTLVAGPVTQAVPSGVTRIDVVSAEEMHQAVMERVEQCDIFIGVAAVADYRAQSIENDKIKKLADEITVKLIRNPDILGAVAGHTTRPFTVGFAAETHQLEHYAQEKLQQKNLDMIAANYVGGEHSGFGSDSNALSVLLRNGETHHLQYASKKQLAQRLIALIAQYYRV